MAEAHPLGVMSVCGSLRKTSFNAAVQHILPAKPVTDMADAIRGRTASRVGKWFRYMKSRLIF